MNHDHAICDAKHVAPIPRTHRMLMHIQELLTLEVVIGILHLIVTCLAVFGIVQAGGGGH